jgi:hypothetical protein
MVPPALHASLTNPAAGINKQLLFSVPAGALDRHPKLAGSLIARQDHLHKIEHHKKIIQLADPRSMQQLHILP